MIGLLEAAAETKFIRLRNEVITTSTPVKSAIRLQSVDPAVSGLFLIQFNDRMQPAWRDQLRTNGVELLHYVPDDAFVAHVNGARLSALRGFPFVQWVGPFEAKHKLHSKLTAALSSNLNSRLSIKLLARPGASGVELASIAKMLHGNVQHRRLSVGTIFEGEADPGSLLVLARSSAVLWIERAARMKLFDEEIGRAHV